MRRDRRHLGCSGGFTLLELILVMIILCTVLAMAAPSLRGFFSSRQLNDLAEQIQLLTRYARVQAVSEARYFRLEFDFSRRQYGLTVQQGSRWEPINKSFGMLYPLPADVEFEFEDVETAEGKYVLTFDLQGNTKPCRIRLRDNRRNGIDLVCPAPAENFLLLVLDEEDI